MSSTNQRWPDDGHEMWREVKLWGDAQERTAIPGLVALLAIPDRWFPEDQSVRRAATHALARMGIDELLALDYLADSDNWLVREGFADALGELGDPRGVPTLKRLAQDPDERVVLWAALSLAKCGRAGIPALSGSLESVSSPASEAHLAEALDRIADPDARRALHKHLRRLPSDRRSCLEDLLRRRRSYRASHIG